MTHLRIALISSLAVLAACGSDDPPQPTKLPYETDTTNVIGGGFDNMGGDGGAGATTGGSIAVASSDPTECVMLDDATCVSPQQDVSNACGKDDATADVLLDENGVVVDVICYPTDGVSVESFEGPVQDVGNNVVLVLDDVNDGADVQGDVTIDGNNVVLYGHGPDTSVIDGNLHLDKNNALVRGIRITGDVVIDKNNPSIVNCVVEGDLTICGNNVSVALCEVWGKTTIGGEACGGSGGENAILVSNKLASAPVIAVNGTICNDNVLFTDQDGDGVIDGDELSGAVSCSGKAKPAQP